MQIKATDIRKVLGLNNHHGQLEKVSPEY